MPETWAFGCIQRWAQEHLTLQHDTSASSCHKSTIPNLLLGYRRPRSGRKQNLLDGTSPRSCGSPSRLVLILHRSIAVCARACARVCMCVRDMLACPRGVGFERTPSLTFHRCRISHGWRELLLIKERCAWSGRYGQLESCGQLAWC